MILEFLAWLVLGPSGDPGLPTIPPPLPTYVIQNDGTRLDCTPNYTYCWKEDERG